MRPTIISNDLCVLYLDPSSLNCDAMRKQKAAWNSCIFLLVKENHQNKLAFQKNAVDRIWGQGDFYSGGGVCLSHGIVGRQTVDTITHACENSIFPQLCRREVTKTVRNSFESDTCVHNLEHFIYSRRRSESAGNWVKPRAAIRDTDVKLSTPFSGTCLIKKDD